jgi:predicted DCC family thiol-disulfide oxidoreductase YuxK
MNIPPGKYVILYDGSCRFCERQSRRLISLARPGVIEAVDFQQPDALDRFPEITHDDCMKAMHLVEPDGRISKGAEAITRAIATRPMFRWVRPLYYLPGFRQVLDWLYAFVASNRYRLWGKSTSQDCESGTCNLHRS